jgi:hypothetical protein
MRSRWTPDALRARLRTASILEATLPASSRAFAEQRINMLTIAAEVDTGALSPEAAIVSYEAVLQRYTADRAA